MKRKNWARVATSALALTFALGAVGCGGTNDNTTVISVLNFGGGVGKVWLEKAFERFKAEVGDKSYESGKSGVSIDIEHTTKYTLDDIDTAGYNIYFDQGKVNVQQFAAQNKILNINDIVTAGGENSIESKIAADYRSSVQYNGKYYALPHYEIFPCLTYDIELFDENDLYIAAPDEEEVEPYEAFGYTVNFTVDSRGKDGIYGTSDDESRRSCGNDGVYGTSDDGLPSSLVEFLVLCDRIAGKGWVPFALAGNHTDYSNYFIAALTASLSGYEAMKANFTFDGDIEVVTGYSEDPLFEDLSSFGIDLPKPTTTTVTDLSEATGYQTRNQVARYYAFAMMEIFEKAGWFNSESKVGTTLHTTTQDKFIFSGKAGNKKIAMLMEASHWTNEATDAQSFSNFYSYTGRNERDSERRIAWMSLPTQIYEPVQEGQGNEVVLIDTMSSYAFINANIRSNGLKDACKDFLKFLYTDYELKEFVANTGVTRASISLDYGDSVMNRLNFYQKNIVNMTRDANVKIVSQHADNETFIRNKQAFYFGINQPVFSSMWGNIAYVAPLDVFRKTSLNDVSAKDIFEQTKISETNWLNTYYQP